MKMFSVDLSATFLLASAIYWNATAQSLLADVASNHVSTDAGSVGGRYSLPR